MFALFQGSMKMDKQREYDYLKWYEEVYPLLQGYGLWLRGGEINTLDKKEYDSRPYRVLFARLSTYTDVASSFTHSCLYQIASENPDIFPDIAYLPPHNDAKIFEKHAVPWLLGTGTKFGAKAFDMIGFSNSIVQEVLNIPKFLETSGIPLNRQERLEREDLPLIILGGANSIYTTSIWGNDSWVDGVFVGHDASEIKKLFEIASSMRKLGETKKKILEKLENIPAFYSFPSHAKNQKKEIDHSGPVVAPVKGIVPYIEEEIGKGYIEITRGCKALCSFCAENWLRKPYKEFGEAALFKEALKMKMEMGLEEIDLSSFNFNIHSEFYKILWDFSGLFKRIGLKSQRFDVIAADPAMVEYEHAAGKSVFSAGLEGISARLRKYLNKNLDDEILKKSLGLVFKMKVRELKIFILSTGLENDDDYNEFNRFLEAIKKIKEVAMANTRVIFSITPLVKFPWTPLEFDKAYLSDVHAKVISSISGHVERNGFEARKAIETKEYVVSQILVRAADEKIKYALLNALKKTDFTYYNSVREPFFSRFMDELSKEQIEISRLFDSFSLEESMSKPWANVETGIRRKALWEVYKKNVNFEEIGKGLYNLNFSRPGFSVEEYKKRVSKITADETEKSFFVNVGKKGRGVFCKYFGIVLARAIMKAEPSLAPYFRSFAASRWAKDDSEPYWVTGDDIVALRWDKKVIPLIEEKMLDDDFLGRVQSHLEGWGRLKKITPGKKYKTKIKFISPYKFNGEEYFKKRKLKHTLFKETEGKYRFEFTKESVKKNIILELNSHVPIKNRDAGGELDYIIEMTPGDKFDAKEFMQEAFECQGKHNWVKINATSIME